MHSALCLMSHPTHLILSAGTRVVTRNEVNRIGGGAKIAAGAVAVPRDSAKDALHSLLVAVRLSSGRPSSVADCG